MSVSTSHVWLCALFCLRTCLSARPFPLFVLFCKQWVLDNPWSCFNIHLLSLYFRSRTCKFNFSVRIEVSTWFSLNLWVVSNYTGIHTWATFAFRRLSSSSFDSIGCFLLKLKLSSPSSGGFRSDGEFNHSISLASFSVPSTRTASPSGMVQSIGICSPLPLPLDPPSIAESFWLLWVALCVDLRSVHYRISFVFLLFSLSLSSSSGVTG